MANLTLMALGSSAPEILLAIIETIGNGFESGQLGINSPIPSLLHKKLHNELAIGFFKFKVYL